MAQRFCLLCNAVLGISGKKYCRSCKEKVKRDQEAERDRKRVATATENGLTLVHHCLLESDWILDPPPCDCRKLVSFEVARKMVQGREAVDFETRKPIFVPGRPILLTGTRKTPARATLSGRVTIERKAEDSSSYDAAYITHLQKVAAQDRELRRLERLKQIDIEHELEQKWRRSITVQVPEAEFQEAEKTDWGRAVLPLPIGFDQRTEGGVGIDVLVSTPVKEAA